MREVRLIHEHQPRFNRQGTTWQRYPYLKLTAQRAVPPPLGRARGPRRRRALPGPAGVDPRRQAGGRGHRDRGPAPPLLGHARTVARRGPCSSAQLGVSTCPCSGAVTPGGLRRDRRPGGRTACATTRRRCSNRSPIACAQLAAEQRFEEATDVRERATALAQALRRQRRFDALDRRGPRGHRGRRRRRGRAAPRPAASGLGPRPDDRLRPISCLRRQFWPRPRPGSARRRCPVGSVVAVPRSWPTSSPASRPGSTPRPAGPPGQRRARAGLAAPPPAVVRAPRRAPTPAGRRTGLTPVHALSSRIRGTGSLPPCARSSWPCSPSCSRGSRSPSSAWRCCAGA